MTDAQLMAVLNERDRMLAEVARIRDMTGMVRHTTHDECHGCGCISLSAEEAVAELRVQHDAMQAELAEVRRLLLPHPDAKAGEDSGCGCDMHTATTAAAWAAAEMRRLRDELAEQKQLNLQLAERLAACAQVLGRAAERGKVCGCNLDTKPTA